MFMFSTVVPDLLIVIPADGVSDEQATPGPTFAELESG
jgi:hypothetical protein